MVSLVLFWHFATTTNCDYKFWKIDPPYCIHWPCPISQARFQYSEYFKESVPFNHLHVLPFAPCPPPLKIYAIGIFVTNPPDIIVFWICDPNKKKADPGNYRLSAQRYSTNYGLSAAHPPRGGGGGVARKRQDTNIFKGKVRQLN